MRQFLASLFLLLLVFCKPPAQQKAESPSIADPLLSEIERDHLEKNPQMNLPDSSYQSYWCSIEILVETDQNLGNLNLSQVADFLATFHKSCKSNVEYSQWSNEILFKVLEEKPLDVIELLTKNSSLSRGYIINELSTPIMDVNLKGLAAKIESIDQPGTEKTKSVILEALNMANSKY